MTLIGKTRRTLAFIPAMLATIMPAAAQDAARPGWIDIRLRQSFDRNEGLMRRATSIGLLATWVSATDFPTDMPTGNRSGTVTLRISIDANDQITDCQPEAASELAPHLAAWACEKVRQRGKFRHALAADGKPVADVVTMQMIFNLASNPLPLMPPAPPAPPTPSGPVAYRPDIRLVDMPETALRGTPTLTGSAVLRISLWAKSDGTLDEPYCRVERSSDNAEIDKASCAAASSASYAFITPGDRYGAMEMRLRWKKGRAKIENPNRDSTTPLDVRFEPPFTPPAGQAVTETGYFLLTFHPGGRVDCIVSGSTGSDTIDVAACRDSVAHARFKPEINLFGEKISTRIFYRLSPGDSTLQRLR